MKKKYAIDLASKSITNAFSSLEKEIKGYNKILDVSPRTLNRLLKDRGKARKLRNELVDTIGHPYIGTENNFIAVTSTQKLNKAKYIISRYTEDFEADKLLGTRATARGNLFIEKSRLAGNRLRKNVNRYLDDIGEFTSPDLVSKLEAGYKNKADKITLSMSVPKGRQYKKLSKRATETLKKAVSYSNSQDISDLLKPKKELIVKAFLTGKLAAQKIINKKRRKVERDNLSANSYVYYEPLTPEDDWEKEYGYPKHISVLYTLQQRIKEVVGRMPHMHSKSEARNFNYLRYQSGRFANSVEVDYVSPGITQIEYTYMREPYDTFRDSPQHGPGRDPQNIIEGAIREIMKASYVEEKYFNTYAK